MIDGARRGLQLRGLVPNLYNTFIWRNLLHMHIAGHVISYKSESLLTIDDYTKDVVQE